MPHLLEARGCLAGQEAQVRDADHLARRHEHTAFDRVVELADVARPGVVPERLHRGVVEAGDRLL